MHPRLRQYLVFFFGTPWRFLATLCVPLIILAYFHPEVIQTAISNLLAAVVTAIAPYLHPLLTIAFILFAIGLLIRAAWGGGKK